MAYERSYKLHTHLGLKIGSERSGTGVELKIAIKEQEINKWKYLYLY